MALILLGGIVPGVALLVGSKECRAAALWFKASAGVYTTAVLIGFALPFSSYVGARSLYPLPNSSTVPTLVKVILINILLTPLWEEIIWRGYFYRKMSSMLPTNSAIVISSVGWTVWHAGFLYYLHHGGVKTSVLMVFVPQIFLIGIILSSLFTLARGALVPCILFHAAFNASIWTYTASGHPVNDIGAIIAETLFILIVAVIMFRMSVRRADGGLALIESSDLPIESIRTADPAQDRNT
jgi:membrane protease YdiL (CAAX protease family)